jgi:probable DNA repair protein
LFRLNSDLDAHLKRGGTLLVPSRQRAHAVQLAYAAAQLGRGVRVWASPDVLTPSAWARRESERQAARDPERWPRILTAAEEWLLWRQVASEVARDYPFLDAGTLGESLQHASARAADYALTLAAGVPDSEAQLLYRASQLFAARCREMNAASVSALTSTLQSSPGAHPLWLRGFDALPPWLRALAEPGPTLTPGAAPRVRSVRGVRAVDGAAQLEAVAAWCCARLAVQADARLLVVLPGAAGIRERLAALIRGALDPGAALEGRLVQRAPVGVEGGEPLSSLALPAQALAALACLSGAGLEVATVSGWLGAPCWKSPGAAARAALGLLLRERGMTRLDLRELLGALQLVPPELKPAARELDGLLRQGAALLGEGRTSPRRWSERFEAALAALGWPGDATADSPSHQTRLRWRELLEEFGALAASVSALSLEAALDLLRALSQRTPYRPADEDVAVTVTPMLADPIVVYDGIWVGSLSADVLPQPVTPDPFLPLRAQIDAGMPEASVAGRRQQARRLLTAWTAGSNELVLSVAAREGDLELLPSPYLTGIELVAEAPHSLWLPQRLHREEQLETLEDIRGTTFNPRAPLPGGTRALTLQNACAFRAYAELRLGATELVQGEPGVPMDQRGLLLHAALQMLWDRLRDSAALNALAAPALDTLIGECVTQAARALQVELRGRRRRARRAAEGQFDLFTVLSPSLERECRRARSLIRRLCELERTRPPFAVQATEHVTELSLGGGRLRMRLDRVDTVAGGRAVLDYKSGRPGSPDWYGERPTHPQLLAYLTALGRDVVALATVNVTAREVRFTGVAAAAGVLPKVKALPSGTGAPDWSAQQDSWEALIERLIQAFLEGDARVDPAPGACDYCHLANLCRIGAHLSPQLVTHADDSDE